MALKIYFAGSIRGGREDKELYFEIIKHLAQHGKVLTEHVGSKNITPSGEENLTDSHIYSRDIAWVEEADVIIAEVSTPSLGVGYEIGKAESMKKPMLCLYKNQENKRLSAMINGNSNIKTANYENLEDAKKIVDEFFKTIIDNQSNFNHLDKTGKSSIGRTIKLNK